MCLSHAGFSHMLLHGMGLSPKTKWEWTQVMLHLLLWSSLAVSLLPRSFPAVHHSLIQFLVERKPLYFIIGGGNNNRQQVLELCLRCKILLSSFLEKQSINTTAGILPVYLFLTSLTRPLSSWCSVPSLIEFSKYRKGVSRALLRKLLKLTQKISIYVSLTRR